jgi:uroporphyrinogen decarboxylase
MRQAGRSLPEYRALREGIPMLDACLQPDLAIEITLQPVRRYSVDAAIFFSDIVVPLKAIGVDVEIKPGVGPVVGTPIRSRGDLDVLRRPEPDDLAPIDEAVRGIAAELDPRVALIGFAGAPFTVASYLIEGGPSRQHPRTKALMRSDPDLWHDLMDRVAAISAEFLAAQVRAGAQVIQLFDSWAGTLSAADYAEFVQPHSATVLRAVAEFGVPRIHFGVGTSEFLPLLAAAGADVVGVDWRLPLDEAAARVPGVPLQGNLDPALLFAPWPVLSGEIDRILAEGKAAPSHIFNLGHGVLPDTDPDVLARVADAVHTRT